MVRHHATAACRTSEFGVALRTDSGIEGSTDTGRINFRREVPFRCEKYFYLVRHWSFWKATSNPSHAVPSRPLMRPGHEKFP